MQIRLTGEVPVESWNRLGYTLIPKLRKGRDLKLTVLFSLATDGGLARDLRAEIQTALADLGLGDRVRVDVEVSTEPAPAAPADAGPSRP